MWTLLPYMVERMGIMVTMACLLTRLKPFPQVVQRDKTVKGKLWIVMIFGTFGIVGTYTGIEVSSRGVINQGWVTTIDSGSAIANTRNLGVVIGGLLGGPLAGLGVGMIAGWHRYLLGGFTDLACAISTVAGGLIAGWVRKMYVREKRISPAIAACVGGVVEMFQMGIILLVVKPYDAALELVKLIGLPMVVVNSFDAWIFMQLILFLVREEERTRALEAQKALFIADRTLQYFRQGLNVDSCREAARIIFRMTGADAVAVTDRHRVLAHIGVASDHHRPDNQPVITRLTRTVLEKGEIITAQTREDIGCSCPDCPLSAAVVLPLKLGNNTVGTIKLYFTNANRLNTVGRELAERLAGLFSTQLELGEAELQSRLLRDAGIKALQAQIYPHFLFNAIHTIVAICRTDAERARTLLLNLGAFLRSNLQGARQTLVPLEKEMEHVETYLSLEQDRFPGKYKLEVEMEPGLEKGWIPPFTIQPLVENAVRHGFAGIREGGLIQIAVSSDSHAVYIRVRDNGVGMPKEKSSLLGTKAVPSAEGTGTALQNIRERLTSIYGGAAQLRIDSKEKEGTTVCLEIPLVRKRENPDEIESLHR